MASQFSVTPVTVRKWLGRYLADGEAALADASSRPRRSPRAIGPAEALLIVAERLRSQLQALISKTVGVSESTVGRVLTRPGLSKLSDLESRGSVQRYEHAAPGDLLHIDTKHLDRTELPSHRFTGNRRDSVDGADWDMLFVAIDDHARTAFTLMHLDEKTHQEKQFLKDGVAHHAGLGVAVKFLLTDNGTAFRSNDFAVVYEALGISRKFTRAYRPQINGSGEPFIQSALREWAYGWTHQHST